MTPRFKLDSAWIPAVVVGVVGVALSGAGPVNGDAAVYAQQAVTGALTERWTHVGYVALLQMFSIFVDVHRAADLLSAVCAAAAIGLLGTRLATLDPERESGSALLAGTLLAGLVLPWAPFGEVDPVWLACLGVGVLSDPRLGGLGLGAAVLISPTSLAAMPWIVIKYRDYRWVAPVAVLVLITGLSLGAYWTGNRGLATGGWSPDPVAHFQWLIVPILMGVRGVVPVDMLVLVGLLAPGDVPGHWVVALPLIAEASRARDRLWWAAVAVLVGLGLQRTVETRDRVLRETALIAEISKRITPAGQVVGPWSWGVRIAVATTGESDGIPHAPGRQPCEGERVFVPMGTWESCGR